MKYLNKQQSTIPKKNAQPFRQSRWEYWMTTDSPGETEDIYCEVEGVG